ncbi:ABC transporter ATP-binding protein [Ruminococcus flavefaciens]|uniref:ABC-2 type transport system ATP-binding protein n=1 Tax=Ruminococcus flavefaciens TaxID=1265 RepID=A0A315Y0R8_RUMFL|nr:ABC transporter ATP-binding protein [Ruminococcus flavefaciens]PWJ13467.1 ABC-2 type transport system ATP-binding protein [Ruminococcus flavefaciens]SSA47980.1 ABC-2 type transport system ATP-binding protein [Ruminococcus flavefaciens]
MAENENVIEVKDVTKSFKVYLDKGSQLKERLLFRKRSRYEERKVLRGISFSVKKGEAIGLIGHNGCGKSTTLKLLTRIMYPDSGSIKMQGRVSSLIELGAGFHPDMSGRENIYTNAAIFGLNKKEIDSRIQSIIDFSELKDFIDNPVRTYSSGMYMRLAFSVAINVDADILLIDEILAVGDANFQSKCFNKLREIKSHGTTIVIVSHSLGQIEQICDRSIWIHDGLIKAEGPPKEIDLEYLDYMSRKIQDRNKKSEEAADTEEPAENKDGKRWGSGEARIKRIRSFASDGTEQSVFRVGEDIRLTVDYTVKKPVQDAVIGFGIFDMNGVQCYGTNTRIDKLPEMTLTKDGTAEITMKNVQLLSGEYMIDIAIEQGEGIPVDYYRQAYKIQMLSAYGDAGIARVDHTWNLQR